MALYILPKLKPLETPIDYPKCLDRIVEAAMNRANFEVHQHTMIRMFIDSGHILRCDPVLPKDFFKDLAKDNQK